MTIKSTRILELFKHLKQIMQACAASKEVKFFIASEPRELTVLIDPIKIYKAI
jgi:hypothetical protein